MSWEACSARVPLERLALSPQCGFATSIIGNPITPDDQRAKLALAVETAHRVWGPASGTHGLPAGMRRMLFSPHVLLLSTAWPLAACQTDTARIGDDVTFVPHALAAQGSAAAAADLDNDGHQDLVVVGDQLMIFRGDGSGGFVALGSVPAGENPDDAAVADVNGDGILDIAVANHDTDYLTILLGNGTGKFRPAPNSPLRITVRPHPHQVRAADLDADGHVDLIVDHRHGEGLLILRGLGDGAFATPGQLVESGGDPYLGMAVGDLDGDGRLDLVTPNPRNVGVLLSTEPARLEFRRAPPVPAPSPFGVGLGDVNGDGTLDLIAASNERSPLVQVFRGDGRGGFTEMDDSPFDHGAGGKKVAVGDFDGDGIHDAAVANFMLSDVLVILGAADTLRTGRVPGGENPWGLVAADFNEDGGDDLVIVDYSNPRTTVYLTVGN